MYMIQRRSLSQICCLLVCPNARARTTERERERGTGGGEVSRHLVHRKPAWYWTAWNATGEASWKTHRQGAPSGAARQVTLRSKQRAKNTIQQSRAEDLNGQAISSRPSIPGALSLPIGIRCARAWHPGRWRRSRCLSATRYVDREPAQSTHVPQFLHPHPHLSQNTAANVTGSTHRKRFERERGLIRVV